MIIGITGGTGSGKTTALNIIREQGGLILDCDAIYHELLQTDPSLLQTIEAHFPGTVVDGVLQRKKLGNLVFSDPKALLVLNDITHSAVKKEVLRRLEAAPELVAIDAIALFEGGLADLCNVTVAVTAPLEHRVQRLMARDCITEEYARKRIQAQKSDAWFGENADFVLENTGTAEDFRRKCLVFLSQIGIIEENHK